MLFFHPHPFVPWVIGRNTDSSVECSLLSKSDSASLSAHGLTGISRTMAQKRDHIRRELLIYGHG